MNVPLLRDTFATIATDADGFTRRFYERLLSVYPQLSPMFAGTDFDEQRRKLAATLASVVALVDRDGDQLETALASLGRRHAEIGTRPEHYPMVTSALLTTMSETLGEAWTPEAAATWSDAMAHVSARMIAAQEAHAA